MCRKKWALRTITYFSSESSYAFCFCLHFVCSFIITFIAFQFSDNMHIQGKFWIGKWSKCLFQSCSLRRTLNFSHYIQSCRVHIHAIFTCVHALMHGHDSQRYTAISCSSPKSCALTVTVVAVQHMMWGLETVLHKNLHILAYLLCNQLNYLSVSLHWYWKILSICISSWCSC